MKDHKVSIIVPSRNTREDLNKCLRSVFEHYSDERVEVIVSDNNSSDGTIEMLRTDFAQVKLSRSEERGSYASAVNRGVRSATGEFLLFLDSDVIIQADTIPQLVDLLLTRREVGASVSKMFYPDGTVQLMARKFPTVLNSLFGRESILTKLFPGNRISRRYLMLDELSQNEPFGVDWASSACMMIKKSVIEKVGYFDEGFPFYWADADFCRRVKDSGFEICCVPKAGVIHDMRNEEGKKKSSYMIKTFHFGAYRYFRKYYVKSWLNPLNLLAIVGLSGRAALQILLNSVKSERG